MRKLRILLMFFVCLPLLCVAQNETIDTEGSQETTTEQLEPMTQARMKVILEEIAGEVQGSDSQLLLNYDGVQLAVFSVEAANRMRIVSAVTPASELTEGHMLATLLSNYHLALDARYAIGDGYLYTVFIHPLAQLTEQQLISAVRQVATLNKTFGTTYSSGEMSFGAQSQDQQI